MLEIKELSTTLKSVRKDSVSLDAKTIQRYANRSLPWLIAKAQEVFNRYIRNRDADEYEMCKCISCGNRKHVKEVHAGHYLSAGHNQIVRFEEDNCHAQCVRCNTHLHGNQANYRMALIEKIGPEAVEELEMKSKYQGFKYDRFTLIEIITRYTQKNKSFKN